ncbi:MAG: recombinase family protein [Pseudobdellovibrionaceae bacterium]
MRSPILPYGYDWLDGQLVVDPKEYRVVQKILSLWRKGQSPRSIAKYLNGQNITTRLGKQWFHSSIKSVIKRETKPKGDSNGNQ